jgi:hypothetical protein
MMWLVVLSVGLSAQSPLATLRRAHPRLIALETDIERVRKLAASDPVAGKLHEQLREAAERLMAERTVEYIKIGPRLLSESRRCLDRVYGLALLYRLHGDKKYLERAKRELFAAAAFPDWNPSHFLDTAEMSHAFAIGYDWLYEALSEEERRKLREALVEKGLKPAAAVYRSGRGWPLARHNWNQVCNGGIAIGALAVAEEEPELAGWLVERALGSIQLPMAEYAPDGGWKEGPGYWHYATRYNVYFLAALETALGKDFGLGEMPGFREAGRFRVYFTGPTRLTFNYADASAGAGNAAEMFWLARRFGEPLYAWHERESLGRADALDLLWYDPRQKGPREAGLPLDALFRGVEVAFFRSAWEDPKALWVGFKGGDNKANHSHVDLGSFVLDWGGVRWAEDLGPDDYNLPFYFGKERWNYFRLRTESHNTLLINGQNQDPKAAAPMARFASRPEFAFAVAELAAAYGARRAERGVAMVERRHVLVQDEVELAGEGEIQWTLLTQAAVEAEGARASLRRGGETLEAKILAPEGARFEVLSANPPAPQRQNPEARRLVVRVKGERARVAVVLGPEAGGYREAVRALGAWR